MKKLAFFVEGMTESVFVQRLVRVFFPPGELSVTVVNATGTGKHVIKKDGMEHAKFHVLIRDCENDERVLTQMREFMPKLESDGFCLVVGVRDLHPREIAQKAARRAYFEGEVSKLATLHCRTAFVVSVHQVEAMFIADGAHFARLSPSLTPTVIAAELGADWATCDVETIANPTAKLKAIYAVGGIDYDKSHAIVERVVGSLCVVTLYVDGRHRSLSLNGLFNAVESI